MKLPTIRKVLNRGYTPIKYREEDGGTRWGWEISRDERRITVQFPDDERPRKLPLSEGRYIEVLK